jgi:hypothetical protein
METTQKPLKKSRQENSYASYLLSAIHRAFPMIYLTVTAEAYCMWKGYYTVTQKPLR